MTVCQSAGVTSMLSPQIVMPADVIKMLGTPSLSVTVENAASIASGSRTSA